MNDFSQKRQELKRAYMDSMVEKSAALQNHYALLEKTNGDVEDFLTDLHKLTGSAGMYGFEKLSVKARFVMSEIEATSGDVFPPNEQIAQSFAELLAMMKNID